MRKVLFFIVCAVFVVVRDRSCSPSRKRQPEAPRYSWIFRTSRKRTSISPSTPGAMAEGVTELKVDLSVPNWGVMLAPSSASAENRVLSFCNRSAAKRWAPTSWGPGSISRPRRSTPGRRSSLLSRSPSTRTRRRRHHGLKIHQQGRPPERGHDKIALREGDGAQLSPRALAFAEERTGHGSEMFMGSLDFDGWRTLT